jgi:hypothetical protein
LSGLTAIGMTSLPASALPIGVSEAPHLALITDRAPISSKGEEDMTENPAPTYFNARRAFVSGTGRCSAPPRLAFDRVGRRLPGYTVARGGVA